MRGFGYFFLWLVIGAMTAAAHPVAQGAMEIRIQPERIDLRARASNEQAFVAAAFSTTTKPQSNLAELWQAHGEYLLAHLELLADGVALPGRVVQVTPPDDKTPTAMVTYDLQFPLPPAHAPPRSITVRQDVLNEFEFVPGNRWEATYVVRVVHPGGATQDGLLLTSKEPLVLTHANAGATSRLDTGRLFRAYLHHGVIHILTGYDHLLFVSALVLATLTLWDLVKVVTAFTIAHTVTLALSALNVVRLPSHVVEPMIAASIVFVAVQNLAWPSHSRGWTRLLVAFGFGLFHGLGFAGGLVEAMQGLPGSAMISAIAAFSIGVELGHQAVVLPLFGALKLARSRQPAAITRESLGYRIRQAGSAAIGVAGMFYLIAALR